MKYLTHNNFYKQICLIISVLFVIHPIVSQTTETANFLSLPTHADEFSMGPSSSLSGVSALHFNPAAIADKSLEYLYSETSLSYQYLETETLFVNITSLVKLPANWGSIAIFCSFLNYQNIPNIDTFNNINGTLSVYSIVGGVTYGIEIPIVDIGIGANMKAVHERLHDFTATGFAADISVDRAFILFGKDILQASLGVHNLGTPLKFDVIASPLPMRLYTSVSYLLHSGLPSWFSLTISPYFLFTLTNEYIYGAGAKLNFVILKEVTTYVQGKYVHKNEVESSGTFGLGAQVSYNNSRIDFSASVNPFATLGIEFYISCGFNYRFEKTELSPLKGFDFLPKEDPSAKRRSKSREIEITLEEEIELEFSD